jgi:hypothetical protein
LFCIVIKLFIAAEPHCSVLELNGTASGYELPNHNSHALPCGKTVKYEKFLTRNFGNKIMEAILEAI